MIYLTWFLMLLQMFVGVILIAVILLQRGRGGGLAGAFGGMGGQSAFGTKAGDLFTRITIVLATVWIVLSGVCVLATSSARPNKATFTDDSPAVKKAGADDEVKKDATGEDKKDSKADDLPMPSDPPKTDAKKDDKSDVKPEGEKKPEGDKTEEKKDEPAKDAEKPAEKPADKTEDSAPKSDESKKPEEPKKPEGEAPKESEKK